MAAAFRALSRAFEKHALVCNSATCVVLYAGGDVIEQKIEGQEWDKMRTARMAGLGILLGPCNHFWYSWLDKAVPAVRTAKTVGTKILMDQIIFSPLSLTTFFVAMGTMEGKTRSDIWAEMQELWLPTYKMDWSVWPGAQLLNFYFVPSKFRVLYVSTCTLAWNVYLSKVKHTAVGECVTNIEPRMEEGITKLERIQPLTQPSHHTASLKAHTHMQTQNISKAEIAMGLPLGKERHHSIN